MKNKDREFNEELVKEIEEAFKKCCYEKEECRNYKRKCDTNCQIYFTLDYLNQDYKPKKTFSEVEKIIATELKDINYLAREKSGNLYGYSHCPTKEIGDRWKATGGNFHSLIAFNHLFQSIQWGDDEATPREDILKEEN